MDDHHFSYITKLMGKKKPCPVLQQQQKQQQFERSHLVDTSWIGKKMCNEVEMNEAGSNLIALQ
jgi:hypothetical protein